MGIQVDTDALSLAARGYEETATAVPSLHAGLSSALDQVAAAAANDHVAAGAASMHSGLTGALRALADGSHSYATKIHHAAARYRAANTLPDHPLLPAITAAAVAAAAGAGSVPFSPPWWSEQWERLPIGEGGISFELTDAWELRPPEGAPAGLSQAELQVLAWLHAHQGKIMEVAEARRIDPRAIAAAIAWEALQNVKPFSVRAVGPGKVHYASDVVHQVEERGYLSRITDEEREELLKTPDGAIDYIGAIMAGHADVAAGFDRDVRQDIGVLTNEYQGRDLVDWEAHLARKPPDAPFVPGNDMAIWAGDNMPFLDAAVGTPAPGEAGPPPPPSGPGAAGPR